MHIHRRYRSSQWGKPFLWLGIARHYSPWVTIFPTNNLPAADVEYPQDSWQRATHYPKTPSYSPFFSWFLHHIFIIVLGCYALYMTKPFQPLLTVDNWISHECWLLVNNQQQAKIVNGSLVMAVQSLLQTHHSPQILQWYQPYINHQPWSLTADSNIF